jgi:hypothetical protein
MKSQVAQLAYALLAAGLIVLIFVIIAAWPLFEFVIFDDSRKEMNAAKKYMDSLTDEDIQGWIQRTKIYLEEDNPTNLPTNTRPVPPDLQQLGITGIEEWDTNEVDYEWLGGMDHTALDVVRVSNGDFQVFAVYTPYSNRMIWPRQLP